MIDGIVRLLIVSNSPAINPAGFVRPSSRPGSA
jgi:hypothetical protein